MKQEDPEITQAQAHKKAMVEFAQNLKPYDPKTAETNLVMPDTEQLKKKILAQVEKAVMHSFPLPDKADFPGSGIYLLYYFGDNKYFAGAVSDIHPVYVGCASSWTAVLGNQNPQYRIWTRLNAHEDSILTSTGLQLKDFGWKAIPMDDFYALSAENFLLRFFDPVLNSSLSGFGTLYDRELTLYDAIFDRPGNKAGKLRPIKGEHAALYAKALEKADESLLKAVKRTQLLHNSGKTLTEIYRVARASMNVDAHFQKKVTPRQRSAAAKIADE